MSDVTETIARRELKSRRLEMGWSYDQLTADINRVLGGERLSMPTVRRFIQNMTDPHDTTVHDVCAYLAKVAGKAA